jgi:hypothetical protein
MEGYRSGAVEEERASDPLFFGTTSSVTNNSFSCRLDSDAAPPSSHDRCPIITTQDTFLNKHHQDAFHHLPTLLRDDGSRAANHHHFRLQQGRAVRKELQQYLLRGV